MSKNAPTLGEQETIRRSKNPSVIMTADGIAETTVEIHDFYVFVTVMLLDNSTGRSDGAQNWVTHMFGKEESRHH